MTDTNIQLPSLGAASSLNLTDLLHVRQGAEDKKATITLLKSLLLNDGNYDAATILALIKTVDGVGSGLDADLLDGQQGSYYRDASNLDSGTVPQARLSAAILLALLLTVDGSGSGLDADLLDGQQGSYYQNASNLNAGTVPEARLPNATTRGSAKLHGSYNGATAAIKGSYGISTVSKIGTGRYRVSFPSLGTAIYTVQVSTGRGGVSYTLPPYVTNKTSTTFDIETDFLTGGGSSSAVDISDINFTLFL